MELVHKEPQESRTIVKAEEEERVWTVSRAPVQPSDLTDEKSSWLIDLSRMPHLVSWPTTSRTWTSCLPDGGGQGQLREPWANPNSLDL